MLRAVIDASLDLDPDLWRRYLGILLRGLCAHPELKPPLPDPSLRPEDVDRVMSHMRPAPR